MMKTRAAAVAVALCVVACKSPPAPSDDRSQPSAATAEDAAPAAAPAPEDDAAGDGSGLPAELAKLRSLLEPWSKAYAAALDGPDKKAPDEIQTRLCTPEVIQPLVDIADRIDAGAVPAGVDPAVWTRNVETVKSSVGKACTSGGSPISRFDDALYALDQLDKMVP